MSRRQHEEGDCWSPCVWCYEDDWMDERTEQDEDEE